MRRTMHKWFWAWDFEKEEKWLNRMSSIGLHLVAVGWCKYVFEEGTPGEYTIRLEMLHNWPTHPESMQYIKFVEDTGAEYLGSVVRFVYLRKKLDVGGFDLFSDIESRIRHLNRILLLLGVLGAVQVVNMVSNLYLFFFVHGLTANLVVGILIGAIALLLVYGFIRTSMKKRKLKKNRALHE